ncbi:hypothetical protein K437DRAFT_123412 [Tilletiaria anomala UBC 951]|uniref:Uncharacterized protein n=1 Tax=Tilletiaria anomala (strain ATCC 24038 / CBS 436.72 / UBC 951) TaxID=1037660 RepID=A0A066VU98_TILAU|nr:uncharacterized protein K437DRAFT_123412 [Tilletiaria anomala UBC 951]KDN45302.1 hypothetical protein K437DRAFT_123412 [Tilletiaria anomala UBC 951]
MYALHAQRARATPKYCLVCLFSVSLCYDCRSILFVTWSTCHTISSFGKSHVVACCAGRVRQSGYCCQTEGCPPSHLPTPFLVDCRAVLPPTTTVLIVEKQPGQVAQSSLRTRNRRLASLLLRPASYSQSLGKEAYRKG